MGPGTSTQPVHGYGNKGIIASLYALDIGVKALAKKASSMKLLCYHLFILSFIVALISYIHISIFQIKYGNCDNQSTMLIKEAFPYNTMNKIDTISRLLI